MKSSVLLICLLVCIQEVFSACPCLPFSNERKFCDSDYVLKVRILSKLQNPNRRIDNDEYYNIRVLKQYKAPGRLSLMHEFHVYTSISSGLCGVTDLQRHQKYLISGSLSDSRMNLDSCNSIVLPYSTRKNRKGIKKLLKNPPNCDTLPEYHGLF